MRLFKLSHYNDLMSFTKKILKIHILLNIIDDIFLTYTTSYIRKKDSNLKRLIYILNAQYRLQYKIVVMLKSTLITIRMTHEMR